MQYENEKKSITDKTEFEEKETSVKGLPIKEKYLLILKYKPNEKNEEKMKILDSRFIIKNINNCKIIYKNKKYELKEYFEDIDINYSHKDLIKIKMIFMRDNIDMSYMFYNCKSLISISDMSNLTNFNIKDVRYMFHGCQSSIELPDFYITNILLHFNNFELIYKIDKTSKGKLKILGTTFINNNQFKGEIIYNKHRFDLKEYFEDFDDNDNKTDKIKLLLCLDDNIHDISYLFYKCDSLISIKDIYELDNNIENNESNENDEFNTIIESSINDIISDSDKLDNFYGDTIQELLSIPIIVDKKNILKENEKIKKNYLIKFNGLTNMSHIFEGCQSLISLPDLSIWNTTNVNKMNSIFQHCKSLLSLPDISKWNIQNVQDISNLFYGCHSLISLPDISDWNTINIIIMYNLFRECKSLNFLPDISKWEISNVKDLSYVFCECNLLKTLPDISKWNLIN